jgi:hypothetical protein
MVVHVLADVSQEARRNDADRAKRDAHVVDVLVSFSVSNLAGRNHQFVCTRDALSELISEFSLPGITLG